MRVFRLAGLKLRREWRAGEYWILMLGLVVAVTSLTAVSFFTSRIDRGMAQRANEVLAADIRLQSTQPIPSEYVQQGHNLNLQTAQVQTFNSIIVLEGLSSLTTIYGVSQGYPLRGNMKISDTSDQFAVQTTQLPVIGEVWADPRLLARLNAQVGSTIQVGKRRFKISKVLHYRPDQGTQFVELAPTLLMRLEDVESTGLVGVGSRVQYRQLFAGNETQRSQFQDWLATHLKVGIRMQQLGDASPQLQSAIERASRFLNLTALISVILAGVAVAMTARRYVIRHVDTVAMMKCMGATQNLIIAISGLELLIIGLIAGIVGTTLGYVAQFGLAIAAQNLMKEVLPSPGLQPIWLGMLTPLIILSGFALPPLLQLKRTPPARIVRQHMAPPSLRYLSVYVIAVCSLLMLLLILIRDIRLVSYVAIGTVVTVVILGLCGYGMVRCLALLRGTVGISWRYGMANIGRRGNESIVQLVAFGISLMVMLLLLVVRNDLLNDWRSSLPDGAPNQFLINISPDQAESLKLFFTDHGIEKPDLVPMLRARMISINGKPVHSREVKSDRGRGFLEREMNLTWSTDLPEGNKIIMGKWWRDGAAGGPQVSVEARMAEELDLKIGDVIRYDVAGQTIDATLASVREVRWDSFRPNFFMVFSPMVLEQFLGTYITSVHIGATQRSLMSDFYREFPEVTAIDIDAVLGQVRSVIDTASMAIQYVFAFSLLAGIAVLLAAVQSTRDERRYESAMLRTLGASRQVVLKGLAAEFIVLGLLSGLLAASTANVVGYFLATEIFNLKYYFDFRIWWIGVISGVVVVGLSGIAVTRSVIDVSPSATLRER